MLPGGAYLSIPFSTWKYLGFLQTQARSLGPQAGTILDWAAPTSGRKVLPSKVNGGRQESQQYQGI